MPTLFVQAGPNGAGKSSTNENYIPLDIKFIDTDEISKKLKTKYPYLSNTQELANEKALEQVNKLIIAKQSYGIETNLYDQQTWDFIESHRARGYNIEMIFFVVQSIDILNQRIKKRVAEGGHFVRPDIVEGRYHDGLHFLKKNYHILYLIDSSDQHKFLMRLAKGQIVSMEKNKIPVLLKDLLNMINSQSIKFIKKNETIEDVRKQYKKIKRDDINRSSNFK